MTSQDHLIPDPFEVDVMRGDGVRASVSYGKRWHRARMGK